MFTQSHHLLHPLAWDSHLLDAENSSEWSVEGERVTNKVRPAVGVHYASSIGDFNDDSTAQRQSNEILCAC